MTDHRNGRQVTNQQDEKFDKQSHGRNSGSENPGQKENLGQKERPVDGQKFTQTASDFTLAEQAEHAREERPPKREEQIDFGSSQLKSKK